MPWVALYDGEKKAPRQVPTDTDVECPDCGERMRVWSRSSDGKARHFKHIGNIGNEGGSRGGTSCGTIGESELHKKWKSLAADRLEQVFEENVDGCEMEKGLAAPVSGKEKRDGDAVLWFETWDKQLGKGIVAEVQHKNEDKNVSETTADYLQQGYAVVWLDEEDFGEDRCQLDEKGFRQRAEEAVWPQHVPRVETWWKPKHNFATHQDSWHPTGDEELSKVTVPATLPREWNDKMAREVWEATDWNRIVHSESSLEKRSAEDYIKEVRSDLTGGVIRVKLPYDWEDELSQYLWESKPWDALFSTPDSAKYRAQAAIPRTDASQTTRVSFPPQCTDTWRYMQSEWEELFDSREESDTSAPVILEIQFAPVAPTKFWIGWFIHGKEKRVRERGIERPETAFEDVQCHQCGHYIYWESAEEACDSCGEEYDWFWNVYSGRISGDCVPAGVEIPVDPKDVEPPSG